MSRHRSRNRHQLIVETRLNRGFTMVLFRESERKYNARIERDASIIISKRQHSSKGKIPFRWINETRGIAKEETCKNNKMRYVVKTRVVSITRGKKINK